MLQIFLKKQMELFQRFKKYIQQQNLFQQKDQLLLAVSGGIDSVVLCELCKQGGLNFIIAHCNFNLRGEESERDERFVKSLGEKYGVEVLVKRFDTNDYADENGLSIQEAARKLRYDWFAQLLKEKGFAYTLLAHHADDNMETLLMNFFRGTGLQGLTAIPEVDKKNHLLRPLLHVRRKEIEAFAKENNLQWVEDSSNSSTKYTRNFFRHEIIPAIKKVYPQVEENLLNNIDRFKKINVLYQSSVEKLKQEVCEQHLNEVRIPIRKLMKYETTSLLYEIIKDYGFGEKQVDEVMKLMEAESGKFIENGQYQIIRHRNWLIVAPKLYTAETIAIEKDSDTIQFSGGQLQMCIQSIEKFSLDKSAMVAQLDVKHIEFPLLLRKWEQGDYFYPLGMHKKKKLSRFFIDQKLSKNQKENIWIIESNKKIIWIVGLRIDDRFKITPSTKEVLQLTISNL
jgi:tRNA(Ile)-lysidine synthase